jgi:hypothetical protein
MPLRILEILKGGHSACLILAERQQAGRRLTPFFRDNDDPNVPFGQIGERLQEVDFTLFVESFDACPAGPSR